MVREKQLSSGKLTTRNDKVLRLAEYFLRADYLHDVVHELKPQLTTGELKCSGRSIYFTTHVELWLASLFVVIEGYKKIGLIHPPVDQLIPYGKEQLRGLRNNTLHFNLNIHRVLGFFDHTIEDVSGLNWAEELHAEFTLLFHRYATRSDFRRRLRGNRSFAYSSSPIDA